MRKYWDYIKEELRKLFSLTQDLEEEDAVIEGINPSIYFKGGNLWILVFAILLACLGLNVNSTAVIIGAMLVSPLMGPIIGLGLSVGINDLPLLKRSLKNYIAATAIGIITATIYFALTPYYGAQNELLARTSPTLYDVLIAFCGGAAGILAMAVKGKGNVIPGVAIATALMPPLCTAGYGIATGHLVYFFGAFYLYFINSVFIAVATYLGVRMMGYKHKVIIDKKKYQRVRHYILAIVVVTLVPAAFMTINIVRDSLTATRIENFVDKELNFRASHIVAKDIDKSNKIISVAAIGREITHEEIEEAKACMGKYRLADYRLNIIQGGVSDSLLHIADKLTAITATTTSAIQSYKEQLAEMERVKKNLEEYTQYEHLTKQMMVEVSAIFPQVESLSISNATESSADTAVVNSFVQVVARVNETTPLSKEERERLESWIKRRIGSEKVELIFQSGK